MKILAVGDVVSQPGLDTLNRLLRSLKKKHHIDFVIVNGENASGVGITPAQADDIFSAGVPYHRLHMAVDALFCLNLSGFSYLCRRQHQGHPNQNHYPLHLCECCSCGLRPLL